MMKANEFKGYKVVCGDQFPRFMSIYTEAVSMGRIFAYNTKVDAKVFGIMADGSHHLIMTCRGKAPRT